MAGLQGNGGLSALEATWPAASEIQVEILRYLNVQDIWNLRKTNKNMNRLFMGPARPGVGNTILHYLGAHCNEIRGYTPCVNGPRSDVRMQYCQGQELLNTGVHGPNQGGSHNVCQACLHWHQQRRTFQENNTFQLNLWSLCPLCRSQAENAYPEGYNSCTCRSRCRDGWKCDDCCDSERDRLYEKGLDRKMELGGYGNPVKFKCRCGKAYRQWQQAALLCVGCEGQIVAPRYPGRVIRRSERVRECNRRNEIARRAETQRRTG